MSDIWKYIQEMLMYKESLGYAKKTYEGFLNDFSRFAEEKEGFFSEEIVSEWCIQRTTEKEAGFRRRITALREFSKYLYSMGISDFVVSNDILPKVPRYTPYIFSDTELLRLFQHTDSAKYDPAQPAKHLVISVIYKLIYFCGLRPNEGRELMMKDVDLDEGTLLIRKNKSHRERLIPMSDDVVEMCRNYHRQLRMIYPDSKYFFPSASGEPYSAKWLTRNFLTLWNNAKTTGNTARVRVYDLRHRYATAVCMKWLDENEDLYVMLPYLSAYMGHARLEDTAYYIHLLPEKLRRTASVNWSAFEALLPEVENEK